jgi:uncharacterized protein YuzB (UPF0349 family)
VSRDGKWRSRIEVVSLRCMMLCQLVSDLLYADYSLVTGELVVRSTTASSLRQREDYTRL